MSTPINFLSGFLQGFAQTRQHQEDSKRNDDEKKAKLKLYEIQLHREEQQQAQMQEVSQARQQLFAKMNPVAPSADQAIESSQKPQELLDLLADHQNDALFLKSGLLDPKDFIAQADAAKNREMQQGLLGGQGQPGSMSVTGARIDASGRTSFDLSNPNAPHIGNYNPGDYTPASFAKFAQSKDPAVLQRQWSPQQAMAMSGASGLAPAGLDLAAETYRMTGKLPAGLYRIPGASVKIINQAAEQAAALGNDAQATVLGQQANKAAQTALGALTRQKTMVGAFEKTTLKNLNLALQESEKTGRTGVPVINRWLLAGKKNILGDVEVGRFNAALVSALNEYAKVLSGATGSAAITDSARAEAESLISTANTPEQVRGIMDIMRQEMHNRMTSFDDQELELKGQLIGERVLGSSEAQPASADIPSGSRQIGTSGGKPVYQSPDGKKWIADY